MSQPIKMTEDELKDFKDSYQVHKDIQSGKKSIFTLDENDSDLLNKGIVLIEKYTDPDEVHDDEWEWINSQLKTEN